MDRGRSAGWQREVDAESLIESSERPAVFAGTPKSTQAHITSHKVGSARLTLPTLWLACARQATVVVALAHRLHGQCWWNDGLNAGLRHETPAGVAGCVACGDGVAPRGAPGQNQCCAHASASASGSASASYPLGPAAGVDGALSL